MAGKSRVAHNGAAMIPGPIYLTILFTLIVGALQGEMMRRNQTVGTTFSVWLAVTGILGYTAKLHDFSQRPPRIMALIVLSARRTNTWRHSTAIFRRREN